MIVQMNFDRISVTIVIFQFSRHKKKLQRLLIPFKTIFASEKKAFLDYLWCNFSVLVSIDVYTVLEVIVHFFSFLSDAFYSVVDPSKGRGFVLPIPNLKVCLCLSSLCFVPVKRQWRKR